MTIKRKRIYEIIIISLVIILTSLCAYMGITAVQKSMRLSLSFQANPSILCQIEAKSLASGSTYDVIFRNTNPTVIKEGVTLNGAVLNIGNLFFNENSQALGTSFMLKITNLTQDKHLQIYLSSQNSSVGFDKDYLIIDYNEDAELTISGISMPSQVEMNFTATTYLNINQPETSVAYTFSGATIIEPFQRYSSTLLVKEGYAANVVITTESGKTLVRDKDYTWNEENGQLIINSVLEETTIKTEWGAKLKTGLEITDILFDVFSASTVSSNANAKAEEVVAGISGIGDGASVYAPPITKDNLQTIIFGYYDQYPDFRTTTADRSLDANTEATNTNGMIRLYRDGTTAYILSENKIFANEDSSYMFSNYKDLSVIDSTQHEIGSITLNNFDTSKVQNMSYMFDGYLGANLDLTSFDTSSATNMAYMFSSCSNLTSLDVSKFDTSKVTNMAHMFYGRSNLTSLNLINFDTSSVTDMSYMFSGCSKLTSLDVSSFDTSSVTNMDSMFSSCSNLISLDVSSFDTSNVMYMDSMFDGCSNLISLDVSSFDTSNVMYMQYMFDDCSNLTSLDLSSFDTSKVTYMNTMFDDCSNLTSLDLSSFDTSKVTDMNTMFDDCSNLITIYVSEKWSTTSVINSDRMFYNCTNLVGGNGSSPYNYTDASGNSVAGYSVYDATYAKIDGGSSNPGYFTRKS